MSHAPACVRASSLMIVAPWLGGREGEGGERGDATGIQAMGKQRPGAI